MENLARKSLLLFSFFLILICSLTAAQANNLTYQAAADGSPPAKSQKIIHGELKDGSDSSPPVKIQDRIKKTPSSIIAADFDRDRNIDLAATAEEYASVAILLGRGDGTFNEAVYYPVGNEPSSIISADFNRDGRADLAITNEDSGTVSVLLGRGNGTFNEALHYPVGNEPSSIISADFNRDGRVDLAVANEDSGMVSIILGRGDGTFDSPKNHDSDFRPHKP